MIFDKNKEWCVKSAVLNLMKINVITSLTFILISWSRFLKKKNYVPWLEKQSYYIQQSRKCNLEYEIYGKSYYSHICGSYFILLLQY